MGNGASIAVACQPPWGGLLRSMHVAEPWNNLLEIMMVCLPLNMIGRLRNRPSHSA